MAEYLGSGYKLAVASGSWAYDIRAILKYADADQYFPIILGKESAPREKPHPDIFLKAAASLNLASSECLVIEDALKGLAAAKKAGMPCIIIRNRLNQNIDFPEADLICPSLDQLLKQLEQIL